MSRVAEARGSTGLVRDTATITFWNAVSRVTGFVRVLAVGAALGTTFLGNTYQSSNLVSNILFELLAAGLLSAPLIPAFVAFLQRDRRDDAERLAGSLLTLSGAVLGTVAVVGMVLAPWIMRLLTVGVHDPAVRASEVRVGAFWLWFFLPQVLLYAVGGIASALLNAQHRFAAVAFAPVANNVVVTTIMVAFIVLRSGGGLPGLGIGLGLRVLLGLGTTLGVLAMALVPVIALRRSGMRLRPRPVDRSDPALRSVGRVGFWGAMFLGSMQLLIAVTLVLANQVEGGVVAYQIAFTFFLLPYALLAQPIFTAVYPRLSADAAAGRWPAFASDTAAAVRATCFFILPSAGLLAALAGPALRLVRLGALDRAGAELVGRVLAAYALGLAGYSLLLLLVRAATAADAAKDAAVVGLGTLAGGAALMIVGSAAASGTGKVVALGLGWSVAVTLGAVALFAAVRRRAGVAMPVASTAARSAVAAAAGGLVAWAVVNALGYTSGRLDAALALIAGALTGLAAIALVQWALRTPLPRFSGPFAANSAANGPEIAGVAEAGR